MASFGYNSMLRDTVTGAIDFDADTFKVMLVGAGYTESRAHSKRSDVSSEVSGAGYTAGGAVLVPTVTLDAANNRTTIVFPAVSWASSTITARKAVYYKSRGGAATADELVCVDDFGADISSSGAPFTLGATTVHLNSPA